MVFLGSSLLTEYLSSSITALHAAGEINTTTSHAQPTTSLGMGLWTAMLAGHAFTATVSRHVTLRSSPGLSERQPRTQHQRQQHTAPPLHLGLGLDAVPHLVGGEMNFELLSQLFSN